MKQRIFLLSILISLILMLAGCGCEHQWNDANCEMPKTCSLCELTDGEPLGHIWEDATCLIPMTCSRCNQVSGDPLPHNPGNPEVTNDYIRGESIELQYCSDCGTVLDSKLAHLSMIRDKLFVLNAEEMVMRLNTVYADMGMNGWYAELIDHTFGDGSTVTEAYIYHNTIKYAEILFKTLNSTPDADNALEEITPEQKSQPILAQLVVFINFYDIVKQTEQMGKSLTDDEIMKAADSILELFDHIDVLYKNVVAPVLITCDPALTESDIEESLSVYKQNTLITVDFRGELPIEYLNFFSILNSHVISINASEDYCLDIDQYRQ